MNEAVKIALKGIERFRANDKNIDRFSELFMEEVTSRSDVAMRLMDVMCAHPSMQQFFPMFVASNDTAVNVAYYSFLEQMEMAIKGAGQLALVRVSCSSGCWNAFLLKDEKDPGELTDCIVDQMFSTTNEDPETVDFKVLNWEDMIALIGAVRDNISMDRIFTKQVGAPLMIHGTTTDATLKLRIFERRKR